MSRVSIVIPCYNDAPEHLEASVQCARDQTYEDVEIIVVDDGSTRQETLATMDALSDVQVIKRANGGTGSALNSGIRAATGEFILPLGADDLIAKDFVSLLVGTLKHSSADVVAVYPTVAFIGERSGVAVAPETVVLSDILVRNKVVTSALYRRRDWELVGGYGEFNDCSEDWYFWALLLGKTDGRMVQEPRARFFYRIRQNSRNTANRGFARKQNVRRHIAEALPDRLYEMFLASADQADAALAEAERYGAFVEGWRQRTRFIRPVYKYVHRLLFTAR